GEERDRPRRRGGGRAEARRQREGGADHPRPRRDGPARGGPRGEAGDLRRARRDGRPDRHLLASERPQPERRRADRARPHARPGGGRDRPDGRGADDRPRPPRPGAAGRGGDADHRGRLLRARGPAARRARRRPDGPPSDRGARVGFVPMPVRSFTFTSESVTEGHPDKVAAQIGYTRAKYGFDAETCGVIVAIDEQSPDIAQGVDTAFEVQHDPGDDDPLDRVGAGDQGMMFGYATDETPELMPLPIMLAHKLAHRLSEVRKADMLPYLRPDGKVQVSVRYEADEHGRQRPVEIERVLVSAQHREGLDPEVMIKPDIVEHVLEPILPHDLYDRRRLDDRDFVYVNPTG